MMENREMVNHPDHYKGDKYECIEVMLAIFGERMTLAFCLLNAFKYLWRSGKKHDDDREDIRKTVWYLNKYLEIKGE